MPSLGPFVAARPNDDRVDLARFLAPPYDVVSPARRAELAAKGPNVVELTLPEGDARYEASAKQLRAWLDDGTLALESVPALYLYEQTAIVHGGSVTVRGLLASVSLDDADGVKPHELVYEKVVSDRLALLEATQCDLEAIIAIYDGDAGSGRELLDEVQRREPLVDVTAACCDDRHRLWRIDDAAEIETLVADLAQRTMVIADGHHRWTTARRAGADSMLMLLQDIGAHAPAVLPIHRVLPDRTLDDVLQAIRPYFDLDEVPGGLPDLLTPEPGHVFYLLEGDRVVRAAVSSAPALMPLMPSDSSAARRRLDIAILHEAVFDELLGKAEADYEHTVEEVRDAIAGGGVGILVQPTPLDAVLEVAGNGELMPRKSTFFLPKPVSGLVMRPHEANRTGATGV